MAAKSGGFFKKALNLIGLVDNPQSGRRDEREDERDYGGYRGYNGRGSSSRPSTYVPRQQRSRTEETRRRTVVSRNSSDDRGYGGYDEGYTVRRTGRTYEDDEMDMSASRARESRRAPEPPSSRPGTVTRRAAPTPQQSAIVRPGAPGSARTVMFTLKSLAECSDVVDTLIANDIVLLMLDKLDNATIQRVVDTMSGAAFALHATIRKASDRTYLIAPRSVEVNDPNYFGRGV